LTAKLNYKLNVQARARLGETILPGRLTLFPICSILTILFAGGGVVVDAQFISSSAARCIFHRLRNIVCADGFSRSRAGTREPSVAAPHARSDI
jgi:hypothetical protein